MLIRLLAAPSVTQTYRYGRALGC